MDTLTLFLIVIILSLYFMTLKIGYERQILKAKIHMKLRQGVAASNFSAAICQVLGRIDQKKDSERELFQRINTVKYTDLEQYEILTKLLISTKKPTNTTIVQNIEGPSNNGNVNLSFQANLLPIFPSI